MSRQLLRVLRNLQNGPLRWGASIATVMQSMPGLSRRRVFRVLGVAQKAARQGLMRGCAWRSEFAFGKLTTLASDSVPAVMQVSRCWRNDASSTNFVQNCGEERVSRSQLWSGETCEASRERKKGQWLAGDHVHIDERVGKQIRDVRRSRVTPLSPV